MNLEADRNFAGKVSMEMFAEKGYEGSSVPLNEPNGKGISIAIDEPFLSWQARIRWGFDVKFQFSHSNISIIFGQGFDRWSKNDWDRNFQCQCTQKNHANFVSSGMVLSWPSSTYHLSFYSFPTSHSMRSRQTFPRKPRTAQKWKTRRTSSDSRVFGTVSWLVTLAAAETVCVHFPPLSGENDKIRRNLRFSCVLEKFSFRSRILYNWKLFLGTICQRHCRPKNWI